jgi:hypothetical protein
MESRYWNNEVGIQRARGRLSTMRSKHLIAAFVVVTAVITFSSRSANGHAEPDLMASSLTDHPPIGALGFPLGTCAEIRAVVVGQHGGLEKESRGYLLEVISVNGHDLPSRPQVAFEKPSFIQAKVASDPFGLYEMKNGKKIGTLNESEIAELEKGYVGKEVHLLVYETGGYSGIPKGLPGNLASWQDHQFCFSTRLLIVAERP